MTLFRLNFNTVGHFLRIVVSFDVTFMTCLFVYDRKLLFIMISQEGKNTPSNPMITDTRFQKDVLFSPRACLGGRKICNPITTAKPIIIAAFGNSGAIKPYFATN